MILSVVLFCMGLITLGIYFLLKDVKNSIICLLVSLIYFTFSIVIYTDINKQYEVVKTDGNKTLVVELK